MKRLSFLCRQRSGFLLLEAMIGIAVFSMFVTAIGLTLLYGQENTIMSGDRVRGTYLNQRMLDGARAMRDGSYASLTAGQHGMWVDKTTKLWAFSGSTVRNSGSYATSLTISSLSSNWIRLTAQTKWKRGYNRSGSVLTVSELTNWRATGTVGNWSSVTAYTYTDGATPLFNNIAVSSGGYAFVTAANSIGLYVFNVTNTAAAPTQVNASLSLGYSAYEVAVRGTYVYVLTNDSTQELRIYNVASPTTFGAAQLVGSYDIPGSGRARALAIAGNKLFIGTTASAVSGEDEFYSFRIATAGTVTLLDTINNDTNGVEGISVTGTGAYLASSDANELQIINVASGSNVFALTPKDYSGTLDGMSVAVSGTSALLGRMRNTSDTEIALFDLSGADATVYHEGSGSVVGLAMDPTKCYAFVSADSNRKAFQIFDMSNSISHDERYSYNSSTGKGRGLYYDMKRDRLFLTTDRSFIMFAPGTATNTCP